MHHSFTILATLLLLSAMYGYIIYEIVSGFEIGKKEKKGVNIDKYKKQFNHE